MKPKLKLAVGEFIPMVALLVSLAALSTDSMLPALFDIAHDLGSNQENDRQLIITVLFIGMAAGQLIFGPVSDSLGRRSPMLCGLGLFAIGSVISAVSTSLSWMLVGRFVQGVGIAGPRILSAAMIRDLYTGKDMARIMSLVMMIFILMPMMAPLIGQAILLVSHWRMIFWFFVGLSMIATVWFWLRQAETQRAENRVPFSLANLRSALKEVLSHPVTRAYMLSLGLVFGCLFSYLVSSQQILQELYGTGVYFALYFSLLAFAIGVSAFANSKIVMRVNMGTLCKIALISLVVLSGLCLLFMLYRMPTLYEFLAYLGLSFFCLGLLFGNLNTMAMEPMGHIAGMAASVIGSASTLISLTLGFFVGQSYNGSVQPLVISFFVFSALALIIVLRTDRMQKA